MKLTVVADFDGNAGADIYGTGMPVDCAPVEFNLVSELEKTVAEDSAVDTLSLKLSDRRRESALKALDEEDASHLAECSVELRYKILKPGVDYQSRFIRLADDGTVLAAEIEDVQSAVHELFSHVAKVEGLSGLWVAVSGLDYFSSINIVMRGKLRSFSPLRDVVPYYHSHESSTHELRDAANSGQLRDYLLG